jgi:hypothetical protein
MKYQYFVFEEASIIKLEMRVEYVWEEVANPTEIYKSLWCTLLSIVQGIQFTTVFKPCLMKWFANKAPSVRVCDAPTKIRPLRSNFLQVY